MMLRAIASVIAQVVVPPPVIAPETAPIVTLDTAAKILRPVTTRINALAAYPLIRISLVILALGIAIALIVAARRMRGGEDLKNWLRDFPWTPFRIMNGIGLATGYVIFLCIAMALGVNLDLSIVIAIGSFILLQEGLDISQYGIQRKTFNPEASAADAAARAASTGAPVPMPVAPGGLALPPAPVIVNDLRVPAETGGEK